MHAAHVEVDDGRVDIRLEADEDVSVARWAAERQGELFERAFGKELKLRRSRHDVPPDGVRAGAVGFSLRRFLAVCARRAARRPRRRARR